MCIRIDEMCNLGEIKEIDCGSDNFRWCLVRS